MYITTKLCYEITAQLILHNEKFYKFMVLHKMGVIWYSEALNPQLKEFIIKTSQLPNEVTTKLIFHRAHLEINGAVQKNIGYVLVLFQRH